MSTKEIIRPKVFLLSDMELNMEKELQLEREKSASYWGTARVRLHWLTFQDTDLDTKQVQILKLSFQKDCRRLDIHNHIPAIIDQQSLQSAFRLSGIAEDYLPKDPQHQIPELGFWEGYQLRCLHGRHRVEAAKLALAPWDKWWTVDLYSAGTDTP